SCPSPLLRSLGSGPPPAPRRIRGPNARRRWSCSAASSFFSEDRRRMTDDGFICRLCSVLRRRFSYDTCMLLLIVEDDRYAADYLVKAFREIGHVADRAPDGEEGLALALEGQYDVLVVDRMLPKLDGLSLIGQLRAEGVETPVLILSALGQVDDRVKGLRAGGDDYLPKPYSFAELAARVEVLSRRRGGRNEETVYRV